MFSEADDTFFTQNGKHINAQLAKKNASVPFKEHEQFALLVDILARKNKHHAIMQIDFADNLIEAFLEAFTLHLMQEHTPAPLKAADLILLHLENLSAPLTRAHQTSIKNDIQQLCERLNEAEQYLIIALPVAYFDIDLALEKPLDLLIKHPHCRLIVLTTAEVTSIKPLYLAQFDTLIIENPHESDMMHVLKQEREAFENFHHVVIPDELVKLAYDLADRYLGTQDVLNQALQLLDSSAARAAATERSELNQFKPVLTPALLAQVLANWIHVPANCLMMNKFKYNDFMLAMEQRIAGQEAALHLISQHIQQTHLHHSHAPFSRFLFVGAPHTGKQATALALTEQLFKQAPVLYTVQSAMAWPASFAQIKLSRFADKKTVSLKQLIQSMPYAVILIEHIEQLPLSILEGIHEVISTGFLQDENGQAYDFRKAMLMLTTTLGAEKLMALNNAQVDAAPEADLMQLLMLEADSSTNEQITYHAPDELSAIIKQELVSTILNPFLNHVEVVPFFPLDRTAIEQIIRDKLKALGKLLEAQYGVELTYAHEVLRYLANQVLLSDKEHAVTVEKPLKDLHFVTQQAILNQADMRSRSTQLFLQLNETGQLLRCDWLTIKQAVSA